MAKFIFLAQQAAKIAFNNYPGLSLSQSAAIGTLNLNSYLIFRFSKKTINRI